MPAAQWTDERRRSAAERRRQKEDERRRETFDGLLAARMEKQDMNRRKLGERLGVTGQAMGYKIKNRSYSYEELATIFRVLEYSDEEIIWAMRGLRQKEMAGRT